MYVHEANHQLSMPHAHHAQPLVATLENNRGSAARLRALALCSSTPPLLYVVL